MTPPALNGLPCPLPDAAQGGGAPRGLRLPRPLVPSSEHSCSTHPASVGTPGPAGCPHQSPGREDRHGAGWAAAPARGPTPDTVLPGSPRLPMPRCAGQLSPLGIPGQLPPPQTRTPPGTAFLLAATSELRPREAKTLGSGHTAWAAELGLEVQGPWEGTGAEERGPQGQDQESPWLS